MMNDITPGVFIKHHKSIKSVSQNDFATLFISFGNNNFSETLVILENFAQIKKYPFLVQDTFLLSAINSGAKPELHLFTFAGNFDVRLELEPLGAIFAAIASSLWIVNSVFTLGYMRGNKEKNQTRFFGLVAIAIFGAMGIAASANLITLFIFYEVLTISTFPLVTHKGDLKAKRGGTIYALVLMGTS